MSGHETGRSAYIDEPLAQSSNSILDELIAVLAQHPGGLRRWSVMRCIRRNRQAAAKDISLKFEAEIERTFRQFCADASNAETVPGNGALFYRPKEKAGEVWALLSAPRSP